MKREILNLSGNKRQDAYRNQRLTGIPPINATPMTVPISKPVTNTGCRPIKGTPHPASQATKIPIKTADIILKFKNSATG